MSGSWIEWHRESWTFFYVVVRRLFRSWIIIVTRGCFMNEWLVALLWKSFKNALDLVSSRCSRDCFPVFTCHLISTWTKFFRAVAVGGWVVGGWLLGRFVRRVVFLVTRKTVTNHNLPLRGEVKCVLLFVGTLPAATLLLLYFTSPQFTSISSCLPWQWVASIVGGIRLFATGQSIPACATTVFRSCGPNKSHSEHLFSASVC